MALTVVWEKAAVTMTDGSEKVLNRGQNLPTDGVSDFHRQVLVMIGAVRDFGAPVAVVQAAVDAERAVTPAPEPVRPAEVPPATPVVQEPGVVTKPAVTDNKDAWERYAVARNYLTAAEAESLTKAKLVAAVNERENTNA